MPVRVASHQRIPANLFSTVTTSIGCRFHSRCSIAYTAGTGGVPLQTLFGFARAYVPAGQTVNVWLGLTARDLTRVVPASAESQASIDADLNVIRVAQAGKYGIRIGVRGPNTQESEIAELEFEAVAA